MRSLREKLNAVASTKPNMPKRQEENDPFFCREHIVPIEEISGILETTLEDVKSCDPAFSGTSWNVRRLLFLDTETTGLSGGAGTIAFEVGLGFIDDRGMVIRQYVMRDYHEEPAMMREIASYFERYDTVISFNGKSFDLPLLESRMILSRIRLQITSLPHFDLLHAARRVYKLRLKRCNLASLEEELLGAVRQDDLPGALVPQRYFDYLKTREFALLEDVLRHNLQDVQSLAVLTAHLCSIFRKPERIRHDEDLFGVGKTLIRTGRVEKGRACLRIIRRSTIASKAHMHLASSYKKSREWEQALQTWKLMVARGEGGCQPYIEMAKYYEHIQKDISKALRCAAQALTLALNEEMLTSSAQESVAPIIKRIERLKRKLARRS